jgi:arginine decarboxylase
MNAIYLPKYNKEKPLYIFLIQGLSGNNRRIWRLTPLLNSTTQHILIDRDENGIWLPRSFQNKTSDDVLKILGYDKNKKINTQLVNLKFIIFICIHLIDF